MITLKSSISDLKSKIWMKVMDEKKIDLYTVPGGKVIETAIAKYISNISPNDVIMLLNLDKFIAHAKSDETNIDDENEFNELLEKFSQKY